MTTKLSAMLAPALFALFQPLLAFAQTQQPTGPQQPLWNCPGPWHMWGGGGGFWWIFPMIMLFLIVLAIFFLGRKSSGLHHWGSSWHIMDRPWVARSWGDPTYSALQVLNERFARGEIQKSEYEEKKASILSTGQH